MLDEHPIDIRRATARQEKDKIEIDEFIMTSLKEGEGFHEVNQNIVKILFEGLVKCHNHPEQAREEAHQAMDMIVGGRTGFPEVNVCEHDMTGDSVCIDGSSCDYGVQATK